MLVMQSPRSHTRRRGPRSRVRVGLGVSLSFLITLAGTACVGASADGTTGPHDTIATNPRLPDTLSALARTAARGVRDADAAVSLAFRDIARQLARPGIPPSPSGLIGRNREWGRMYAARFQMGTGVALRTSLALNALSDARASLAGIESGLSTMEPDGRLPSSVPLPVSMGASPSDVDVASGAAFFLGDACLGALALEEAPSRDAVASPTRRRALRERLALAISRLTDAAEMLQVADRAAPNRLLFNARAYLGCGALLGDTAITRLGDRFVGQAFGTQSAAGWFDEGGGWDTSYQAVSIDIGADVLAVIPASGLRNALANSLSRATTWLLPRITADGRVNSAGNRRTCGGGESFLGEPKLLAVASVVSALAKAATSEPLLSTPAERTQATRAVERVAGWVAANPNTSPCFELDPA